jgi:hypothetical protein
MLDRRDFRLLAPGSRELGGLLVGYTVRVALDITLRRGNAFLSVGTSYMNHRLAPIAGEEVIV